MAYDGMIADGPVNTYACFYLGKQVFVKASTTYGAQLKAQDLLKAGRRNRHMISVVLAEKAGVAVEIDPASL